SQDTKHKESTRRTAPAETPASAALVLVVMIEVTKLKMVQLTLHLWLTRLQVLTLSLGYNTFPPPYTRNFLPPKPDLSGLEEFENNPIVTEPTVKKSAVETSEPKASADKPKDGNPQMDLQDKRVIDSGCSRHITGNMSYLTYYEEIDGGYVAFGGNLKEGKITGKSTIKT
nr:hypothetical protein [Tanacetum cinerariifolium]